MYTEEQRKNIADNLEYYRHLFKKKQFEVTDAVGITEGTYSEYVKMKRVPTRENIHKLAKFFSIADEELTDVPLPEKLKGSNETLYDVLSVLIKNIELMFPIINIKNDYNDSLFKEAYNIHKNLFKGFVKNDDFKKMMNDYYESYKNNNNLDSCANIIMILLIYKFNDFNEDKMDFLDVHDLHSMDDKEYLKFFVDNCILNYDDDEPNELEEKDAELNYNLEKKSIKINYDDYINKKIKDLNNDKDYSEFIQYFITLKYLLGVGNNDLSRELNNLIGREMLINILLLDNKYAKEINALFE